MAALMVKMRWRFPRFNTHNCTLLYPIAHVVPCTHALICSVHSTTQEMLVAAPVAGASI